jgi:hypothetical protein
MKMILLRPVTISPDFFYIPNSVYDTWVLPQLQATFTISVTIPRNLDVLIILP